MSPKSVEYMEYRQFKCPRCGQIHNKRDGVKLSIFYKEKERYNPVPTGTLVTSYYKNVYFCKSCDRRLKINRFFRYALVILLPVIVFPIITIYTKGNALDGIGPGIVCSLIIAALFLPLIVIVYRKIKIRTFNKKYIEKAQEGNAIA